MKKSEKLCHGKNGSVYSEGESYNEECVTYTCSKLGKKLMTMVPSVIGRCCDVKGKGLYKVGDIIEVEEPSEEHCHRKTVKCDMTHHDRPQVTTIIDHGHCCAYNGQYYKVGENVPIPSKCLWLQCKLGKMSTKKENIASLEIKSAHHGCDCCLVTSELMIQDGKKYANENVSEVLCYKGSLVKLGDPTHSVIESNIEYQHLDDTINLGNISAQWNQTKKVLSLKGNNLEIIYQLEKGRRVINENNKTCFISKLKEEIKPSVYISTLRSAIKPAYLKKYSFSLENNISEIDILEEKFPFTCKEDSRNLLDVEVTKEMFTRLSHGNMLAVVSNNSLDMCDVSISEVRPGITWDSYTWNEKSQGTVTLHMTLKSKDEGCQGKQKPCLKSLLPFNFIHKCSGI